MRSSYTHIVDLAQEAEPPDDGVLTRTLFNDDDVKAVIFGFGQGEELSEHTASMPAILHFIQGEATLALDDETVEAQAGTWIHMAPNLKHGVKTRTPPAGVASIALIVRPPWEDQTLQEELEGHKERTQRVRYKLIPGVWQRQRPLLVDDTHEAPAWQQY